MRTTNTRSHTAPTCVPLPWSPEGRRMWKIYNPRSNRTRGRVASRRARSPSYKRASIRVLSGGGRRYRPQTNRLQSSRPTANPADQPNEDLISAFCTDVGTAAVLAICVPSYFTTERMFPLFVCRLKVVDTDMRNLVQECDIAGLIPGYFRTGPR